MNFAAIRIRPWNRQVKVTVNEKDYYEILGIPRGASQEDIRKAYRQLAKKYHPDANQDDHTAEERFKEVNEAYEVLKDAEKRAAYDQFGMAGVKGGFQSARGGFGGMDDIFGESIFGDIFESFFGGGASGARTRTRRPQRGQDIAYRMTMSLEEAASGLEKTIEVPRSETCSACGGSGAKAGTEPIRCSKCDGSGQTIYRQGFLSVSRPCDQCQGRGQTIQTPCPECSGRGRVQSMRKIRVNIPAGADTGLRLRLTGEGEAGRHGGPPGDLYVQVEVQPHPIFTRDGDDLLCELPIGFPQAALGAEVEAPTLEGKVRLKVPSGTQSGKVFRLRVKGIFSLRGYGRGDLLILVVVEVPTKLNSRQKELIKELAEISGEDTGPLSKSFFEKLKEVFGD